MDLGSIFLMLALALLVGWFVSRPLMAEQTTDGTPANLPGANPPAGDGERSALLAERDRLLTALQELDFDCLLGKIPAEDYPVQRRALLSAGATVLRRLDELGVAPGERRPVNQWPEPALAEGAPALDDGLEALIQAHRRARSQAQRAAAGSASPATAAQSKTGLFTGFCPKCGRPAQKTDRFCSRCGATL